MTGGGRPTGLGAEDSPAAPVAASSAVADFRVPVCAAETVTGAAAQLPLHLGGAWSRGTTLPERRRPLLSLTTVRASRLADHRGCPVPPR